MNKTQCLTIVRPKMKFIATIPLIGVVFCGSMVNAQLAVTVSPPRIIGQKAIVPLALKNGFTEKIESARAAVFLFDEQGKMAGQATRWVIGGSKEIPGLAPGKTNRS